MNDALCLFLVCHISVCVCCYGHYGIKAELNVAILAMITSYSLYDFALIRKILFYFVRHLINPHKEVICYRFMIEWLIISSVSI